MSKYKIIFDVFCMTRWIWLYPTVLAVAITYIGERRDKRGGGKKIKA